MMYAARVVRSVVLVCGLVWLAACGQRSDGVQESAGSRLENEATGLGLVTGPDASPRGAWARGADRLCIAPVAGGRDMIGVASDAGAGQGCVARGIMQRRRDGFAIQFGDCRFTAMYDGSTITFPSELPAPCMRTCRGDTTLQGFAVDRLSSASAELSAMRTADGQRLCAT